MVIKSYKYRIYPSKRQAETLEGQLAICAELYNAALQERRDAYRVNQKSITWFDQNRQLVEIREGRADIAAVNSHVLESVLRRVDLAFKAFFRRCKLRKKLIAMGVKNVPKPGYPRFRSFRRYDSMTFRGHAITAPADARFRVSKVGRMRIKLTRPIEGEIKILTVRREAGRWFAVFTCEVKLKPLPFSPNVIGVDVGLTSFATLSDGRTIENPRYYRQAERALRLAQRRIARRKKGSNRRRKAVVLLQRIHAHVRAQRADFHHKESRRIVNENGLIAVEDLNVKGLAFGMLSKSVNDAGWAQFLNMIAYKAEWAGRVFVQVNPAGTSQTCTCGAIVRKTLADRWHLCLSCGLSLPRDHVSAQVILLRAQAEPSGVNVEVLNSCVV